MAALASLFVSIRRFTPTFLFMALLISGDSSFAAAADLAAPPTTIAQTLRDMPVFEEPLVAAKPTTLDEDQAVAHAVALYQQQKNPDDFKVFDDFLRRYPQSGWRVALFTNLGLANYHYGYFSRAIEAWEQAWREGRDVTDPAAKILVDRAVGELVRMHARLGHTDRLAALMDEIGDRPVTGQATEALTGAKEGLWTMRNEPGIAYLCGPMALKNLMLSEKKSLDQTAFLDNYRSSPQGVSLAEVGKLAKQAKQPYTLAFREGNAPIPLPALVHWKVSHFATIVAEENGRYHLKDPTFGTDLWITKGALDTESSGYFLLPSKKLAEGFRSVSMAEASQVHGRGLTADQVPRATTPKDEKGHPPCSDSGPPNGGMCGANFHSMVVSLNLTDTPVGYQPPKGPSVFVTLTYNQREAYQPATFNFSNVGPKWTTNWLSYIQDDPNAAGASVMRYVAGGGAVIYAGYNSTTGKFTSESEGKSAAVLARIAGTPVTYRRTLSDGTVEIYAQPDGATSYPRRTFLTQITDPTGNAVTLAYDVQRRLTSITDALGQVTTFSYGITAKPLLITAITDPFGRSAQIAYDASGRLQQITDVVSLVSQFTYDGSGLVNSMTTPYGTSNFAYAGTGNSRWLEITDPLGFTERAEFRHSAPGIPPSEAKVPVGINPFNQYMDARNTFFWDKSLYPTTHTDYTKAEIKHWLHDPLGGFTWTSPVLESIKHPLESRIWFNYPGQVSPWVYPGTLDKPSAVGRVMDNNATQLTTTTYNALGNPLVVTDPVGNQTLYDYAANQIDVIKVRQKSGASTYLTLAQYTYNTLHQPLTYTDANSLVTTYTYNAAGQRLTSTDSLGHTTTYNYNAAGYLTSVIDANSNTVVTLTYDAAGRVATRADAGGNALSYQYDNLNRVTRITYPDTTFYQYSWNKLDLASITDRVGQVTQYTYDANRNLTAVTDPANHTTQYAYYHNGTRKSMTDANGGIAQWARDIQSRLTSVTDPKGIITAYVYDGIGNLTTINSPDAGNAQLTYNAANNLIKKIDGRGVESNFAYDWMNRLTAISYPASPTENLTFVYDYDGFYDYHMGRLSYISQADGFVIQTYDANGNITGKGDWLSTASDGNNYVYDNANRVIQITYPSGRIVTYTRNALGQITQVQLQENSSAPLQTIVSNATYEPFGPIKTITYNNDVTTTLQHDADYRISRITTTSTPAWDFIYSYDADSQISGLADQIGTGTGNNSKLYTYDNLHRLIVDDRPATVLSFDKYQYQYDAGGNRTLLQKGLSTTGAFTYPATYAGTSNRMTQYTATAVTEDAAGNITSLNGKTYSYNNANRLSQAVVGSSTVNFRYNGFGQRTTKLVTVGTTTTTTHYDYSVDGKYLDQIQLNADASYAQAYEYLWLDDLPIAQLVTTYGPSNTVASQQLTYIHADHLNTPRIMTDSSKKIVWRWDPEGYGRVMPNNDPDGDTVLNKLFLRYPGQIADSETGLFYNNARYYDPLTGRYLQYDLIGPTRNYSDPIFR
ncbi:MAG TPA: RHS repeat-associated core domain-containing protein, partial [Spongiibacteraceae bacterium]|nr:RHS repeat-associated core domain-containing protein [Spongiibacteraceae bacterium]